MRRQTFELKPVRQVSPKIIQNPLKEFVEQHIKIPGSGGEPVPTDAYGDVELGSHDRSTAKYIRVDAKTDVNILEQFILKHWKLKKPNLIISVTGGAQNFTLRSRLSKVFRKSLIKLSESTDAWIVTGGTHAGVMKHVGKAVKEYAAIREEDEKLITIGIATWGTIHDNQKLLNKAGVARYDPDETQFKSIESGHIKTTLDKNHSHFILVDNGTEKYGAEIELRANLESKIASNGKKKTLLVCVMVQGGPGSLKTVYEFIQKENPAVIVAGSGGFADVLAAASIEEQELTEDLVYLLMEEFGVAVKNPEDEKECIKMVKESVANKRLLTVFKLDPADLSRDLDIAILEALLKASRVQIEEQLSLALAWNRSDVAGSLILTDDVSISKKVIYNYFMQAVQENKPEFCKLFLDYGVSLKYHFREQQLVELYNSTPIDSVLGRKWNYQSGGNLELIGRVMRDFLGYSYISHYNEKQKIGGKQSEEEEENNLVDDPLREIFQWALLMNYRQIAKYVWENMWEPLPAAIVATKILKKLSRKISDNETKSDILDSADEYEQLAIGILANCYEQDKTNKTDLVLKRELPKWGGFTCLHIAIDANDKLFIAQPGVQQFFTKVWMGKLDNKTPSYVILFCAFFLPFIWIYIRFKEKGGKRKMKKYNKSQGVEGGAGNEVRYEMMEYSWYEKIKYFYTAPVVTFWLNVVFFILYLILFAYILLSNFTVTVSWYEWFLLIWVISFLLEEIRELAQQRSRTLQQRLFVYICDPWNMMDLGAITLFSVGFGLRHSPDQLNNARTLYAFSFMIQSIRVVHIFAVHEVLGPKIIMVGKMLKDLLFFLFILIVFLLAYGVASQALLYPNESDFGTIISGIVYKPYWQIYGELFLDEINFNPNVDAFSCSNDAASVLPRCPEQSNIVPIISAVYLLFANVLLLNLLIAMFSYTFENVERQGNEIWKFQRYRLISDYYFRPFLVPPLIIFYHISMFLYSLLRYICPGKQEDPYTALRVKLTEDEIRDLSKWEHWHAGAFLQNKQKKESSSAEYQLNKLNDRVDSLMSAFEKFQEVLDVEKGRNKISSLFSSLMYPKSAPEPAQKKTEVSLKANVWLPIAATKEGNSKFVKDYQSPDEALKEPSSVSQSSSVAPDPSSAKYIHAKSRVNPYPTNDNTIVKRFEVPDSKVSWSVTWEEYSPIPYTAIVVLNKPAWADPPLENYTAGNKPIFTYNAYDVKYKVDRSSYVENYKVIDGIPRNPKGRTGISGRGLLGRYGPNHAADPVVTRWKRDELGKQEKKNGLPVLEFVAVLREDTKEWAIPGGMVDPGEKFSATLKREFLEEAFAFDRRVTDPNEMEEIRENVKSLFSCDLEIYRGYCDDHRNTDNAWIETIACNFHDEQGTAFNKITFKAGDEASAVSWKEIEKDLKLFASHTHILKRLAEMKNAHF